jgi:hypothetical protein
VNKPRKVRPRGTGSLFLRGRIWWIQIRYRVKKFLESTETSNKRQAETLLRTRMAEVSADTYVPKADQKTIGEPLDDKIAHDRNNEPRDLKSREGRVKHLRPFLGDVKARDLTRGLIENTLSGAGGSSVRPMSRRSQRETDCGRSGDSHQKSKDRIPPMPA